MKLLLNFLLVIAFGFASVAAAAPSQNCCPVDDCPLTQCADMGCAAAVQPLAAMPVHSARLDIPVRDYSEPAPVRLPDLHEEPWIPPD